MVDCGVNATRGVRRRANWYSPSDPVVSFTVLLIVLVAARLIIHFGAMTIEHAFNRLAPGAGDTGQWSANGLGGGVVDAFLIHRDRPTPQFQNILVSGPFSSRIPSVSTASVVHVDSPVYRPRFATQLQGIPKMFRWLTDQYPDVLNRQLHSVEGFLVGDVVVDNFYLDMNGIIHPCTHGNAMENGSDTIIILDETAMFKKIFLYVDK
jgi:XRN 5'-3' exonuclease N-terminus